MSDQRCVCGLTEAEHLTLDLRHTFAAQPAGEAVCLPSCYVDDISSPNYWTVHAEGCPNKPTEEAGTESLCPHGTGPDVSCIECEPAYPNRNEAERVSSPRSAAEIRKWIVTRGEFENYDPNATYAITGQQLMAMFESFGGASLRSASWGFMGIVPQEGCVICGESGHPNAICPKAARESHASPQSAEGKGAEGMENTCRIDPRSVVIIRYTNYRGETANRRIVPIGIRFGSTEWHPEQQWLLEAFDLDRDATRSFALKDVLEWARPATAALSGGSEGQTKKEK